MEAPTEQSEVEVRKEEDVVQGEHSQPSETSAVHKIDTDMVSLSGLGCSENATIFTIVYYYGSQSYGA